MPIVALILLLAVGRAAPAAVINVPGGAATIQAGINAASNGDVVQVAPGTYIENINFDGKAITVVSTGGTAATTINGGAAGHVVTFSSGEGSQSVLSGFTITNGLSYSGVGEGGGIYVDNSSPTISGNVITGNFACGGGGGIAAYFGSPTIQSNTITNNSQYTGCSGGLGGGGLLLEGTGAPMVISNMILNNSWLSGNGGGIGIDGGTSILMNNLISGNLATGVVNGAGVPAASGGGIDTENDSDPLMVDNIIVNNTADLGGGAAFSVSSDSMGPIVVNNTIAGNTTTQNAGSALYATGYDGPTELFNNLLIGAPSQNAVYCDPSYNIVPPVFENNDVFSAGGSGFQGSCTVSAGQYGNISADPLFVSSASGDYHLSASSPAIDAGLNSAPDIPSTDYYGNPRIVAGRSGDAAIVDMGAAEFQPAAPIPTATPSAMPTPVGNVISVPEDVLSIQGGIDLASDGDVVQVAPGTYFEAINFGGKAIELVSTGGPYATIIDGHGLGPVVTFADSETTSSVLSGFTITGGLAINEPYAGGGIYIENSSPTVSNNVVTGNSACTSGGGIEIDYGSPVITGNVITNNSQFSDDYGSCGGGDGGGIRLYGSSTAQITSNTISNNSWGSGNGGGISLYFAGSPTLLSNLVSSNLATGVFGCTAGIPCTPNDPLAAGGGISVVSSSPNLIQNLVISNNADIGGGVYLSSVAEYSSSPLMVNNTVAGNATTRNYGSAVLAYGLEASATFINNVFVAGDASNAFYCIDADPVFENNDVFSAGGLSYMGDCSAGTGLPGNISANPLFAAPPASAYSLAAGSPAIDTGTNSAPDLPTKDFYGNPRIVAAHADCPAVVDMGIAEYQGTATGPCPGSPPKPSKLKVPSTLKFEAKQEYSGTTKKLKITNPGKDKPVAIAFSSYGTNAPDFSISTECPPQLAKGGSCSVSVTFTPSSTETESAKLLILNGFDAPIATVKLSGGIKVEK